MYQNKVIKNFSDLNISIFCYWDYITLMSPSIYQLNQLLELCGNYSNHWKIEFGVKKCNWMVFGNELYEEATFKLNS
jgi:hypothetical protein